MYLSAKQRHDPVAVGIVGRKTNVCSSALRTFSKITIQACSPFSVRVLIDIASWALSVSVRSLIAADLVRLVRSG